MSEIDFFEAFGAVFTARWREDAACIDAPEEYHLDEAHYDKGKSICASCPVRLECLDDAIKWEDVGLRGGMTEKERNSLQLHRRRHILAFRYHVES